MVLSLGSPPPFILPPKPQPHSRGILLFILFVLCSETHGNHIGRGTNDGLTSFKRVRRIRPRHWNFHPSSSLVAINVVSGVDGVNGVHGARSAIVIRGGNSNSNDDGNESKNEEGTGSNNPNARSHSPGHHLQHHRRGLLWPPHLHLHKLSNTSTKPSASSAKSSPSKQLKRHQNLQMYGACLLIVLTWITLGTLFYSFHNSWPLPQSFFYAVDAGMSIGFCTDVVETTISSRAFTIVFILLGASCVGGALALMIGHVIERVAGESGSVYRRIVEGDGFKTAFFGRVTGRENRSALPSVGRYKHDGVLEYDEFKEELEKNDCYLTEKELKKVYSIYDPEKKGFITYEKFLQLFQGTEHIVPTTPLLYSSNPLLRTLAKAYDTLLSLFTDEDHHIYLLFLAWIALGVTWGVKYQKWDVITATHFSVSALATGGLTGPPVDENGILPPGPAIFCGVYCLIGIPLFALTLSQFARVLIEQYIVQDELLAITQPLTPQEFQFASHSLCSRDNGIHLSDFIVLQLFRQGKLSVESLEFMKKQFRVFDRNHSGRLNLNEATRSEMGDHRFWHRHEIKRKR